MGADENGFRLEKHRWIAELVRDKTFADIGGLWGTVNETVSIAMRHGAREATMVDVQEPHTKWWKQFHERCEELGVVGYRSVVGDICEERFAREVGRFDITHCSGVIYHIPHPFVLIRNLIAVTRERFLLSSMVVPDRMESRFGTLEVARGHCLLVPALGESDRRILGEHFSERKISVGGLNAPSGMFVGPELGFHYGPWWWLLTSDTLVGMCELFGVEIEKTWVSPHGSLSLLAHVSEGS